MVEPDAGRGDVHYEEKLAVARRVAALARDGDVIGAGSGSTARIALKMLAQRIGSEGLACRIIPTSREVEMDAAALGLTTTSLLNSRPQWCFDGADEVDPDGNMLKGRGGAMYREKLVMAAAGKTYILIDKSKRVARLGERFPVPVEVLPEALRTVERAIGRMAGFQSAALRPASGKDGPVITENGNFILDVRFSAIGPETEKELKGVTGVLESGLFWGYKPDVLSP